MKICKTITDLANVIARQNGYARATEVRQGHATKIVKAQHCQARMSWNAKDYRAFERKHGHGANAFCIVSVNWPLYVLQNFGDLLSLQAKYTSSY